MKSKKPTNDIQMFLHCKECLENLPPDTSPRAWVRIEVGITKQGWLQVWCVRHEKNVFMTELGE